MVNLESRRLGDWLLLVNSVLIVVLINILSGYITLRVDLTEEKRYSIKKQTKELLTQLDDDINIDVYLAGDLNPDVERFRKVVQETLEEFRISSGNKVHYTFIDPALAAGQKARTEFMSE